MQAPGCVSFPNGQAEPMKYLCVLDLFNGGSFGHTCINKANLSILVMGESLGCLEILLRVPGGALQC